MEEAKSVMTQKESDTLEQKDRQEAPSEQRALKQNEYGHNKVIEGKHDEALVWAQCAAEASLSKKATSVQIIKVKPSLVIVDYFVVATADNPLQFNAVAEAIEDALREEHGIKPIGREGMNIASWALLDYGDIVVHIFIPETRDFYRLDKLYNDAEIIEYNTDTTI